MILPEPPHNDRRRELRNALPPLGERDELNKMMNVNDSSPQAQ